MLTACSAGLSNLLSPRKRKMSSEAPATKAAAPAPPAAAAHGPPPEGLECMVTFDDIDETNYVEYQTEPSGKWQAAKVSEDVVRRFLNVQFDEYMEHLRHSDCAATTRRLLNEGPPIW